MGSLEVPKDYGRRLLPIVVDEVATERPDHVVYSFPVTDDVSQGFHEITNQRFANAMHRAAWYLETQFGQPARDSFPTVGYIGPNDLRYAIFAVAAVRAGYKMMYLSPRNSLDGHLAVVDRSDCHFWLLPSQHLGRVDQILEKRKMTVHPMPELLDLLDEEPVPRYPYSKTFDEARQDPFLVLHTSGSTGLPKPIVVPNGSLSTPDAYHLLPPIDGRYTQTQYFMNPHKAYSTFPNFHAAGVVLNVAYPFFYNLSLVLGPPMVPVNLTLVDAIIDHTDIDGTFLMPSTLVEIARTPASLERIAKTDFTLYGGGPLAHEYGEAINKVCRVFNVIGVTEGSVYPIVQAEPDTWDHFQFHPAAGFTLRQRTDELYELVQVRDPKLHLTQAFFQTFPDLTEYGTKDLYSQHPSKPDRWLYRGRIDDVIVLSNGEKVNPLDMEACIQGHPAVKSCLIVGQGQFQTAALIQLKHPRPTTEQELQSLKDSLWPVMAAANQAAPAHAQLHKDFILFAADDKPFPLAGKETVLRAMTVALYRPEIEDFYAQRARQDGAKSSFILDTSNSQSIQRDLRTLLSQILDTETLPESDDLFAAGLDSLSVVKVLASLRATLRSIPGAGDRNVPAGLIYANPSIERLAEAFEDMLRPGSKAERPDPDLQLMKDLVPKYTADLPEKPAGKQVAKAEARTVILTGSTGSLGSYLLEGLLSQTSVKRIFCLNRAADGKGRQIQVNKARGLTTDLDPDRVQFFKADLSRPRFGLDQVVYDQLVQETTSIIHNQWSVDFNLTLPSFEPHIRGVRHLVDLALQSPHRASILFVSSVGVVKSQKSNATVPEALLSDIGAADGGYGRSKLVSEMILAEAQRKSGLNSRICRLGQIAGPVDAKEGMWNKQEWLPTMIASSKYLNMIPANLSSLNRVDWVPVDRTAAIILELAQLTDKDREGDDDSQESEPPVFHVVNPSISTWPELVPAIQASLGPSVPVVPWERWLEGLEASLHHRDGRPSEDNPAVKLIDFYRGVGDAGRAGLEIPVLETKRSQTRSRTLEALGPVTGKWMERWLQQWGF